LRRGESVKPRDSAVLAPPLLSLGIYTPDSRMTSGLLATHSSSPAPFGSDYSRGASIPPALRALPSADVPFRVLVLEAENPEDTLLADVVHSELPDADIVRTAGALGALALANIHKFDLLVIDSPLRADVRMELLQAFLDQNPRAEVILAAPGFATPEHQAARIHVLAQPVNPLELLGLARQCRERALGPMPTVTLTPTIEVAEEENDHFVVVLNRHSPMEVVQFKCLSGATTALDFIRRSGPGGRVWFDRGEVCHAETGTLQGEEALVEMMSWRGGSIVEVVAAPAIERTIDRPWQSLLMYAAHAADERKAQALSA